MKLHFATTAAALLLATGCGKMAVDGVVVDANGDPIPEAMVSAASLGHYCQTRTDAQGKFALECEPGTHKVVINAEGFTTEEFEVEAPERKRYDVGKKLLIEIPDEKGLHLLEDGNYVQMKPGFLVRKLEKDGGLTHRAFCLNTERSEANELSPGRHAMFDYEHPGWRPFKLDEEGCAYRDTKNEKYQWSIEYREKAPYVTEKVNRGKSVALLELAPGDYFVANWDKGFFTVADRKTDKHSYVGFWLKVR